MSRKHELAAEEDEAWRDLWAVLEPVDQGRVDQPGFTDEWSVKDLTAHLGCWQAEAVQVFEQIRNGTFVRTPIDLDAMNKGFVEACRELPAAVVRADLLSARNRMLHEWNALPEITPDAEEWFVECGAEHYREHLPPLREWAGMGT
jgi:mycothiol maleylpyruvate isomerase-like protein